MILKIGMILAFLYSAWKIGNSKAVLRALNRRVAGVDFEHYLSNIDEDIVKEARRLYEAREIMRKAMPKDAPWGRVMGWYLVTEDAKELREILHITHGDFSRSVIFYQALLAVDNFSLTGIASALSKSRKEQGTGYALDAGLLFDKIGISHETSRI